MVIFKDFKYLVRLPSIFHQGVERKILISKDIRNLRYQGLGTLGEFFDLFEYLLLNLIEVLFLMSGEKKRT